MSTKEVAAAAGVHVGTVLRLAVQLNGANFGGSHGWDFPPSAPEALRKILHRKNKRKGGVA